MKKVKVLIVDDSAVVRQVLTEILKQDPLIEVIGVAQDPLIARQKIKALNPDVVTLDIEMPRMDGLTFLEKLMRLRPMPVVMVSTLTEAGADTTLRALELGAVDYVAKPKLDVGNTMKDYSDELIEKVKAAASAKVRALSAHLTPAQPERDIPQKFSTDAVLEKATATKHFRTTERIIAIGASTGGTEAIKTVMSAMPADAPAVLVTQHMPANFTKSFAQRLDGLSAMSVCQAQDGQQINPGHVYIAPGAFHMMVERDGAHFVCRLSDGPPVNRHKPSVDVLFRSVAQNVGANAAGAILTGMGDDGAIGLREMRDAGCFCIAQDEQTCVVYGMPKMAVKEGGVDDILPLPKIASRLLEKTQNH